MNLSHVVMVANWHLPHTPSITIVLAKSVRGFHSVGYGDSTPLEKLHFLQTAKELAAEVLDSASGLTKQSVTKSANGSLSQVDF